MFAKKLSLLRHVLIFGGVILTILSVIVIMRTLLVTDPIDYLNRHHPAEFVVDATKHKVRGERFAQSLTFPTIAWGNGKLETQAFLELHQFIIREFPRVHNTEFIKYEVVNNYSLLYTIKGSDNTRKPYLLAAHLDVVPVDETKWIEPPFGGKIIDDVVWGRGAMDDKHSVMGILEALESLLEKGFRSQRTFYVAFGHDEEVSGRQGAAEISKVLAQREITLDFVLDEGGFIMQDESVGLTEPFLTIAVAEKGYLDLEYSVELAPGHSSIPPDESALGVLAGGVHRLERNKYPSMFGYGPEYAFFTYLAPHVSWLHRIVYSNLWLLSGLLVNYGNLPKFIDGMHRTTTAITIFQSGLKSNIVPGFAKAVVNHRVHPSLTLEDVLDYNKRVMGDDRIQARVVEYIPPPPVAPYGPQVSAFNLVAVSARQAVPNLIVAPSCTIGNTDLRHYAGLTDGLYRAALYLVTKETITGIHGHNERLSLPIYERCIAFYANVILNAEKDESLFIVEPKGEL